MTNRSATKEELLAAIRSFQRSAARYYWLARDSRLTGDIIAFQRDAAELSAYARKLFDLYQEFPMLTAKREYGNHPISGMPLNGKWVVRNEQGEFVDADKYSNDLRDRYGKNIQFIGS